MSRLIELAMEGQQPLVTGQLFFRDTNTRPDNLPKGMKLMMVCGVLAVPENFPVNGEEMVRVQGFANRDSVELHTQVNGTPVEKHYSAWTIDNILMSPIWKI